MEMWDAYKKDGSLAGVDLVRGQPIPDGLLHLVCEILVKHLDGSYLLIQRDFNKEGYPGMFKATAGGNALKGETPIISALRELKEETENIAHELTETTKTYIKDSIYYSILCVSN